MRNIDKGIHLTVTAKLRERGESASAAEAIATKNIGTAKQVFQTAVSAAGRLTESAVEAGFGAVSAWAAKLH